MLGTQVRLMPCLALCQPPLGPPTGTVPGEDSWKPVCSHSPHSSSTIPQSRQRQKEEEEEARLGRMEP